MLKLADYFNKHDIDYDMRYIPESKAIKYTFVKHGYRVILEETIETLKNLDHSSCLVMNFIMDRCKIGQDLFESLSNDRLSF